MTKIDPTPLIAEAQARETALKVAERKIAWHERLAFGWFYLGFAVGVLFTWWMLQ